jgi:hypothetical protein
MATVRRTITIALAATLLPASLACAWPGAHGVTGRDRGSHSATPSLDRVPPITLGKGHSPDVAVGRRGTVTVVWATDWWQGAIKAATHRAGGRWTTPATIGRGTAPQVVVDDRGTVTVAWQTNHRNRTTGVAVARRRIGRSWTAPRHLTSDRSAPRYWRPENEDIFGADKLDLAVGATGTVVVAWAWGSYHRHVPLRIQAAVKPARAPWRDTLRLSLRNWSDSPSVAVTETGDALLAFGKKFGDLKVRRLVHGKWTGPSVVDSADGPNGLDAWHAAASNAAGMTVVYKRDTDSYGTMFATSLTPAGAWSPPEQLSGTNVGAFQVTALADRLGTTTVTWNGMYGRMDAVRRPAGGTWGPPTQLLGIHRWPEAPTSTTNASGEVLVSWFRERVGIGARWIRAGGDWSSPRLITPTPANIALEWATALYPNGDVAAVWQPDWNSGPIKFRRSAP